MSVGQATWPLAALAVLALTGSAAATPPDGRLKARAIADQGFALFEAGKYGEAIAEFQQANALFHAPTVVVMIAKSYAASGKLIQARATYRSVLADKLPRGAPDAFKEAQRAAPAAIAALQARIATLTIDERNVGARSVRTQVDGAEVAVADLPHPIELDPGSHTVVATPTDGPAVTATVILAEGAHESTVLDLAPPRRVSQPPVVNTAVPNRSWRTAAIVSFAVGAVGLAVGAGTGAVALHETSTLRLECGGGGGAITCPPARSGNLGSAKTMAGVSTGAFVVGALGAAAGVVFVVVKPSFGSATRGELSVGPGSVMAAGVF